MIQPFQPDRSSIIHVTLNITYNADTDFLAVHEELPEDWVLTVISDGRYTWSSSNKDFAWYDADAGTEDAVDLTGVTDTIRYKVTVPNNTAANTYGYDPTCSLSYYENGHIIWTVNITVLRKEIPCYSMMDSTLLIIQLPLSLPIMLLSSPRMDLMQ